MNRRIQRPAPGPFDDVERALRIRARADCPHNLVEIGDVDILVDDDDDPAEIGTRATHGRDVTGLACMPRVSLLDRYDVQQPTAADAMTPYGDNVRHAGKANLPPQQGRAAIDAIAMPLVGRLVWRCAKQNRIVALVAGLDVD